MKKIFILIDQFYQHGGIERLVALKSNYWSTKYGYDVTIISTEQKENTPLYALEPSVHFIDLKVNYKREISFFSISNIILLLKNSIRLQKCINQSKPDYIVVASHIPMTYVLPFLRLRNTKIIKEFHFTRYYTSKEISLKQSLFKFVEARYHKLIVLSKEEATFCRTHNIQIIPNPIQDIHRITNLTKKEDVAVAIIRFAPVKQLESMVEAWSLFINKGYSNWRLHIFGDYNNDYGKHIVEFVNILDISGNIIFKGQTSNVLEELSKSKLLLLTSAQECFPLVILEAQSVGVPVISFDSPTGPRNIINNNEDGFIVDLNNISLFASKLKEFASNSHIQDRLSENSLVNAQKYNIDTIMNIWRNKVFV
jgi:glycosyltransferase involved in cell wall biosynthesis